jgi:glutathione synthase/RimK-type ligase-like ATP-grasp enzyme
MKVAILKNENPDSHIRWQTACESLGVNYEVIDMLSPKFIAKLKEISPTFCLAQPPGMVMLYKKMYDEKIYTIEKHLGIPVFPSYNEIVLHENKNALAYFLESKDIPHPKTTIFYCKTEALAFAESTDYPKVVKTSIGAAGSGVKILHSQNSALLYINTAFNKGIARRFGPNRKTGNTKSWLLKAIKSPNYFFSKIKEYRSRAKDLQYGYVLFQEYIEHDFEWRCVKIGNSYFAYKKLKVNDKASGSKTFDYGAPPEELLNFTHNLCKENGFNFMAVDLFYNSNGVFVNELQTVFGHKNPFICMVNNKTGRYILKNEQWVFEEGDFNENESYTLRLKEILMLNS